MSLYLWYVSPQQPWGVPPNPRLHNPADAVPKKRGPKTDVLEALLKRVDGLEARLKDKKTDQEGETSESAVVDAPEASTSAQTASNTTAAAKTEVAQESRDSTLFPPIQPR
jgi:hypothetical protein